jgi:hypothetical protein
MSKLKIGNNGDPSIQRKEPSHIMLNKRKADNYSSDYMDVFVETEDESFYASEVGINTSAKDVHFTNNQDINYAHNAEELIVAGSDNYADILEILEEISEGDV